MTNAFTIDLEDWYHGIGIPMSQWDQYEKRLRIGYDKLLNVLAKYNVKATFFVLGKVIEDEPEIIREIINEGHEIGCHTYSHTELFYSNEQQFETEIKKCIELISQMKHKYTGFRAPYFSIDNRTQWALNIIKKYGFVYDASIFPGDSKRSGILNYRKDIHQLENGLWEAPISTFKILNFDCGLGGAYFRMLPYWLFAKKLKKINKATNAIFYIHPWELDEDHPYLANLAARRKIPHYFNLSKTHKKLERLLKDFEFGPLYKLVLNTI